MTETMEQERLRRRIQRIAGVLLVVISTPALAGQSARAQLSKAVGAMRYVRGLDRTPPSVRDLRRASIKVEACLKAVAAARAAGLGNDAEIDVGDNRKVPGSRSVRSGRGFAVVGRVGSVASYCQGINRKLEVARVSAYVSYAYHRSNRLRSRRAKSPELILEVARAGEQCTRKLAAALRAGTPSSAVIDLRSRKVRVGDARRQICRAAIAQAERDGKQLVTERAEQLASYKRALGGGRWRAFADNLLFGAKVFVDTRDGRREASAPADFAKADVWFEVYENYVLGTEWVVRRYQFSGNKLVSVRITRGSGSAPRASRLK